MWIDPRAVLGPEDVVVITRWLRVPPRDCLKLFAAAIAALKSDAEPAQ